MPLTPQEFEFQRQQLLKAFDNCDEEAVLDILNLQDASTLVQHCRFENLDVLYSEFNQDDQITINIGNNTVLHLAVANDMTEVCKRALELGVDVNAINDFNDTALNVLIKNTYNDSNSNKNIMDILDILLKGSANVDIADKNGETALRVIILSDVTDEKLIMELKYPISKALIQAGANVNIIDEDGTTILDDLMFFKEQSGFTEYDNIINLISNRKAELLAVEQLDFSDVDDNQQGKFGHIESIKSEESDEAATNLAFEPNKRIRFSDKITGEKERAVLHGRG